MGRKSGSEITREIFETLGELAYSLVIAFSRDTLSNKLMKMDPGYRQWEINQSLRRLERSGHIKKKGTGYLVTSKGRARIDYYRLDELSFNPSGKPWDGLWRIIIFDIPEKKRNARDLLRNKIKEWDCIKLQHSVFITPHACDKELEELIRILNVQTYVHVMVVPTLGERLTERFRAKYKLK